MGPQIEFTLTEQAADQIQRQRLGRGTPQAALRVGIRNSTGCSGLSYCFEWDDRRPLETDKIVEQHGVVIHIDAKSFIYLRDTQLDFAQGAGGNGFKLNNPNVKDQCGCGEAMQF